MVVAVPPTVDRDVNSAPTAACALTDAVLFGGCSVKGGTTTAPSAGGKPVIDDPGDRPTSPTICDGVAPTAAVMASPATIAKFCASPSVCDIAMDGTLMRIAKQA